MNLKSIASNMTELSIGEYTILFSYSTPVAYHQSGVGYAKTKKFFSRTTSKHISKWLALSGFSAERGDGLREVEQSEIDRILLYFKLVDFRTEVK